jgi:hypothetical protein
VAPGTSDAKANVASVKSLGSVGLAVIAVLGTGATVHR